jgi:hypothetical protein
MTYLLLELPLELCLLDGTFPIRVQGIAAVCGFTDQKMFLPFPVESKIPLALILLRAREAVDQQWGEGKLLLRVEESVPP